MYTVLDKVTLDGVIWQMSKSSETRYFKNGKANLHIRVTYSVEQVDESGITIQHDTNLYWIESKKEAVDYLRHLQSKALIAERQGTPALKKWCGGQ